MNKAILYIATSLDGFVAGKSDDISWLFRYNDVDFGYNQFFSNIGAIIKGRRTYDIEVQRGWENDTLFLPLLCRTLRQSAYRNVKTLSLPLKTLQRC